MPRPRSERPSAPRELEPAVPRGSVFTTQILSFHRSPLRHTVSPTNPTVLYRRCASDNADDGHRSGQVCPPSARWSAAARRRSTPARSSASGWLGESVESSSARARAPEQREAPPPHPRGEVSRLAAAAFPRSHDNPPEHALAPFPRPSTRPRIMQARTPGRGNDTTTRACDSPRRSWLGPRPVRGGGAQRVLEPMVTVVLSQRALSMGT